MDHRELLKKFLWLTDGTRFVDDTSEYLTAEEIKELRELDEEAYIQYDHK